MNHRWIALPRPGWHWLPVWRRNFLVWRKLAIPSILGNLADPLIYMLGLGYGLGSLLPPQGVAGFWQAAVLSTVAASVLFGFYLHYASRSTAQD